MLFRVYGANGECHLSAFKPSVASGIEISASVGKGGKNNFEDVRTIQDALNQVHPSRGGPDPPLDVDGYIGPKTLSAIRKFQAKACGFKWPDGRVDVEKRTHQKLREFYIDPNPYHLKLIYLMLPNAVRWMNSARRALMEARFALTGGFAASNKGLTVLNKYFHLDTLPTHEAIDAIGRIDRIYLTGIACIGHASPMTQEGSGYFQEDTKRNTAHAYTYEGGYHVGPKWSKDAKYSGPNVRMDAVYICSRRYKSYSLDTYTMVVVHELAHFCGPPRPNTDIIVDHSYRRKGSAFFKLSAKNAMRTADCYAHFAGEVTLGREAPYL